MAAHSPLPGTKFRLNRAPAGSSVYTLMCLALSEDFNEVTEFDDVTMPDCDTPANVPWQASIPKMQKAELSFSGVMDAVKFGTIRADRDASAAGTPANYQIQFADTGANGGGAWTGQWHIENLQIRRQDAAGKVEFTCKLRSQGAITWAAAA